MTISVEGCMAAYFWFM